MIFPQFTSREYLFTKDLAAHIIFAEVKHFVTEMSIHGPSEDEVQTLTRTIQYKIDKDLHWADIDELVDQVKQLNEITTGTHELVRMNEARTVDNRDYLIGSRLPYITANIDSMVGSMSARYELAVA